MKFRVYLQPTRRVLFIAIAFLIFDLGIGGYYWFVVRPQGKETAQFVERPVEAEGAPEDHLQLSARLRGIKSDRLLLEVKGGLKEVAIDERTSFFTFTATGEVVKGEGIEIFEVGKEVEVVYPKPAEGEIPIALSVLVKD